MIIDLFTQWAGVIPLTDLTVNSCAEAHYREWLPLFGVSVVIIINLGMQFESVLFSELKKLRGFKRQWTIGYQSQSNGILERSLPQVVPLVLLGFHTAGREKSASNPHDLMSGRNGVIKIKLLCLLRKVIAKLKLPPPLRDAHYVFHAPRSSKSVPVSRLKSMLPRISPSQLSSVVIFDTR